MDLARHSILVTGGTRGIGFELAKRLAGRGARVAVCGRSAEGLAAVRRELPAVAALACDLGDLDALPAFVGRLREELGAPTILVNNAGIQHNHAWPERPAAEVVDRLREEIRVNLASPLALTALLLDDLLTAEASAIVNVSSLLALHPKRSAPVYCATKAAIRSFSRALRYQLAGHHGIRVVEVVPPLVDTRMTAGRGSGKLSAGEAADQIVRGLEQDRIEIPLGKAKLVRRLNRVAPGTVAGMLRDG